MAVSPADPDGAEGPIVGAPPDLVERLGGAVDLGANAGGA
jgi:hypothetical protein